MTELEMTSLLVKLANYDITGILIVYSGGSGDGQIDAIVYTTKELHKDVYVALNQIDSLDTYSQDNKSLFDLDDETYDLMYDFVMLKILRDHSNIPDWVRHEGGYGHVALLIPSGQYEVTNTIYITETDTSRHEGNLLSKIEE